MQGPNVFVEIFWLTFGLVFFVVPYELALLLVRATIRWPGRMFGFLLFLVSGSYLGLSLWRCHDENSFGMVGLFYAIADFTNVGNTLSRLFASPEMVGIWPPPIWSYLFLYWVAATVVLWPILIVIAFANGEVPASSRRAARRRKAAVESAARKRRNGELYLGKSGRRPVYLSENMRRAHAHLVGATGAGKTAFALVPMVAADIHAGRGLLLIDGKGDIDLLQAVWCETVLAGRQADFRLLDLGKPGESQRLNPLAHGSQTELVDLVIQAGEWESPFYQGQAEKALREAFRLLLATGQPFTLDDLCVLLSQGKALKLVGERYSPSDWKSFEAWLEDAHKRGSISGLLALLEKVARSEFGELFDSAEPEIDLYEAYKGGQIVYAAIQTGRFPRTAPFVGRLVMAQLNVISNMIANDIPESQRKFFPVVIDEFAGLAYDEFIEFLNKSRASGFACVLSHQTLGDLRKMGEHYTQQVVGNTALKLILRQENPEDAEIWGKLIGTRTAFKQTDQTEGFIIESRTGRGSRREVEEYVVHPNLIKSLGTGQAVMVHKGLGIAGVLELAPMPRVPAELPPVDAKRRPAGQGRGLRLREQVAAAAEKNSE